MLVLDGDAAAAAAAAAASPVSPGGQLSTRILSRGSSSLLADDGAFSVVSHFASPVVKHTDVSTNELAFVDAEESNHEVPSSSSSKPRTLWQDDAVVSTTDPPKACLAMIMKNEGPILPRLFEPIKEFASAYCVVDTGSTDDTIDVLRSIDMPGLLAEEPFVDFATTRNVLLDTCRQRTTCEYLVLLDADMVLRVSPDWDWAKLDSADVYDFVQVSSIEYTNVRMIKRTAADKIRVVGATHEYYDVPNEYSHKLLPKHLVHIDDVGDGKAKGDKFERDERLLRRELEKEPDNVRTVFYLANTLKDQGKYRDAIPFYERRTTMGGWYAEADYSWFMLSSCYLALHDVSKAREYAEKAALEGWYRRAEPLYYLAFYLHQQGEYELAWYYATLAAPIPKPDVSTVLFISYPIYDYWIEYERASLCRHIFADNPEYCLRMAVAFLNNPLAPEDLRQYFLPDLGWYTQPLLSVEKAVSLMPDDDATKNGTVVWLLDHHASKSGEVELGMYDESAGQIMRFVLEIDNVFSMFQPAGHISTEAAGTYAGSPLTPLGGGGEAVGGLSSDGHHLMLGQYLKMQSTDQLHLKPYIVKDGDAASWACFNKAGADAAYCVTSWYPTLDVGTLAFDDDSASVHCTRLKSGTPTPRVFSFFEKALHGIAYRGDIWFLVRWRDSVPGASIFSLVAMGPRFDLRWYTLPFTLAEPVKNGTGNGQKEHDPALAIVEGDGKAQLVVAYTYEGSDSSTVKSIGAKMIPVGELMKRVVAI